jgi:hypothetical protein
MSRRRVEVDLTLAGPVVEHKQQVMGAQNKRHDQGEEDAEQETIAEPA